MLLVYTRAVAIIPKQNFLSWHHCKKCDTVVYYPTGQMFKLSGTYMNLRISCYPMLSHVVSCYYSYVKTYLLPDQSKSTKKKTSVKKGVDPIFNETIKVVTIITYGDVYQ